VPAEETVDRAQAVALYDEGRYAEAGAVMETLDAAGAADGPLLYRLYYCQNSAGDARARETLRRSIELMEQEAGAGDSLESPFYLANAYRGVGRLSDMRRVAEEATRRVEQGQLAEPDSAVEMFRLGKLYDDQGNPERASEWFERAVDRSVQADSTLASAYVVWASGYLADRAFEQGRLDDAEKHYARVADEGKADMAGLDRLAVIRARLERYEEAAQAWRLAERLDPANADRARYCGRLALAAAGMENLPQTAPDGRGWGELAGEELEAIMVDKATTARDTIARVQQGEQPLTAEERSSLSAELAEAHSLFVAAALEYALRQYDIRQAAFSGGYAPMVFHPTRWRLPGRGRKR
jgi:tetratricopeptide (TPR) repeat protein